jgi:hypothetical protein
MSTPLICWVNTSADTAKNTIWLKNDMLKGSIFVNLPNKADAEALANMLRLAYATGESWTIAVDTTDIVTKKDTMSIRCDLETVLRNKQVAVRQEATPRSTEVQDLLDAELARLQSKPVVKATTVSTVSSAQEPF